MSRAVGAALFALAVTASPALAADAYWHGVRDAVWGHGPSAGVSNWYSMAPPNGSTMSPPRNQAIFAVGAMRYGINVNATAVVQRLTFEKGAPKYTIVVDGIGQLRIDGIGIVVFSGTDPLLIARGAEILFLNSALAGSATFQTEGVASAPGTLLFLDSSSGETASVSNRAYGVTTFEDFATADDMVIENKSRGKTLFRDSSTGGAATFDNESGGLLDFCNDRARFNLKAGQITNAGVTELGRCHLTMTRAFTQTSTGTLQMALTGAVVSGGEVKIAGKLVLDVQKRTSNVRLKIISSTVKLTGKFTALQFVNLPSTKRVRIDYVGKEVYANLLNK